VGRCHLAAKGTFLEKIGALFMVQKFICLKFGATCLNFGATYLNFGDRHLNFGAIYLNFGPKSQEPLF